MAKDDKKKDEAPAKSETTKAAAPAKTATADEAAPANAPTPTGWTAQQARAAAVAAAAKADG